MKVFLFICVFLTQSLALAGDTADNLALTLLLKNKKFTPQYAENRLNFGKEIEEPYLTQNTSSELGKKFLRPVHRSYFRYWKNYFLKNRAFNAKSLLKRGSKYKQIVENIFIYHNLPKELYYVGLIESRYELRIKSPAGARGPWQFLAATAREYGLIVNRYYDERTNLIKSTHAAAKYFKDLYNIFGSWELALSAYNAGEYGVIRKMRKAGTRDYYKLVHRKILPKETRNYIPKILALSFIDKNSHQFGIKIKKPNSPLGKYENTYSVALNKSHKLKDIASKIGISLQNIRNLNPELRGYYTPSVKRGKTYRLRLPRTRYERFFASLPIKKLKVKNKNLPKFHVVKSGENLSSIAKKYQIPLGQIILANYGLEKKTLRPGHKIKLTSKQTRRAIASASKPLIFKPKSPHSKLVKYKVQTGDTLFGISMLFNVRIDDIKKVNKLKKNALTQGMKLKIPGVKKKIHVVKKGEQLNKIAQKYDMSSRAIRKINQLQRNYLSPGQRLVVIN